MAQILKWAVPFEWEIENMEEIPMGRWRGGVALESPCPPSPLWVELARDGHEWKPVQILGQ